MSAAEALEVERPKSRRREAADSAADDFMGCVPIPFNLLNVACERNGAGLHYQPRPGGGSVFRVIFADPDRWQGNDDAP